jgi:dCMP deaminase
MLHSFSWDQYFMTMAYLVSMKSKDPSTRVGSVIVGEDNEIRATGYNGLPRGIADKKSRYEDREYKLLAINHAEENAILHCALNGVSTRGCTLYSQWMPCSRCAKSIIQSGIKEVVYDANYPGNHQHNMSEEWKKSMAISQELFAEAGIAMRALKESLIDIKGLYKNQVFSLQFMPHPAD